MEEALKQIIQVETIIIRITYIRKIPLHHHWCSTFNQNMKSINLWTPLIQSDLKLMFEML